VNDLKSPHEKYARELTDLSEQLLYSVGAPVTGENLMLVMGYTQTAIMLFERCMAERLMTEGGAN